MTRNLKVLGMTFLAALAIFAVSASAASAKGSFTVGTAPAFVTGLPEGEEKFTTTAGTVTCPNAHYTGTIKTSPTASVTVVPNYGHCTAFGLPALVDVNSCDYLFTIDITSAETKGWVDIQCTTPGDTITVTANENTPNTLTTKCAVHVPPQTVGGIKYDNVAGGKIKITINATGITYSETEGTGLGKCPKSNPLLQHNGTYTGTAIANATIELNGAPTPFDIG